MKDINLTLIHCHEFHPFTQAKRKLVTHGEEERNEEKERNHHNFYVKQKKTTTKETKKTKKETKKNDLDLSTKMILISQPRSS